MEKDREILRELAKKYREICHRDIQEKRRQLWSRHNSFEPVGTPVYIRLGNWENEVIKPQLQCQDTFFRSHENFFRRMIYQDWLEDDYVMEPWITMKASYILPPLGAWGLEINYEHSGEEGGAFHVDSPLKDPEDIQKMIVPHHKIDEKATAVHLEKLQNVLGDIIDVDVDRSPYYQVWQGDISTSLGYLRGIEQIMWDIMDRPEWLHRLLSFMRDGVLKTHREAEAEGDWTLANHQNQSLPYANDLSRPAIQGGSVKQNELWGFLAAQEFAVISPEHHRAFMLEYQIPILERFGLVSYGCCEDLSQKIDILRKVKNLRRIAISPFANADSCAEQIGRDYICSWRPNPSDTVCMGFDEEHVEDVIREGLGTFKRHNSQMDICLKDVNTVQGDPNRLKDFVKVCRRVAEDLN